MHRTAVLGFAVFLSFASTAMAKDPAKPGYPTLGTIERKDPRLDKIVPPGARVERIAEGFDWSEGPVWLKEEGCLLFSDIPPNKVMKWKEGEGLSLYLQPSGYTGPLKNYSPEPGSNGLLIGPKGQLVLCQHGDRRLAQLTADKKFETLADRYQGKRFNSPNDAVLKSNGDIYFTDPPYGLPNRYDSKERELDFCGVYRLGRDGKLTLLTKEMARPNGIAFSPDEKTLYVAQSDPAAAIWKAFPVKEDGTLGDGRVFFDATDWVKQGRKGLPDGLKVDQQGNLYATGPGGVHIFAPDGTLLGTLNTGQKTANCAWGDDGSTLYITADMYLGRIRLNAKGFGF